MLFNSLRDTFIQVNCFKILVFIFVVLHNGGVVKSIQKGNVGREFYVGALKPYADKTTSVELLVVSNSTQGLVTVTAPAVNIHTTQHLGSDGTASFILNHNIIPIHSDTVENKGIHVTSDVDISLTINLFPGNMQEGALALPINALSTEHFVTSYSQFDIRWHSEFLIVGTQDSTTVTFQLRKNNVREMFNTTVHLDAMQTYFYKGPTDISGSIIRSDKPVAVFSGNEATGVPLDGFGGETLFEQVPPTDTFGRYIIVPNMPPRARYVVRIYAKEDDTSLSYENSSTTTTKHNLEAGEFVEVMAATKALVIHSSKPLLASVLAVSRLYDLPQHGDPFMMTIPAISQYKNAYNFRVSSHFVSFEHYLIIIIESKEHGGILYDGAPLDNVLAIDNNTAMLAGKPYLVSVYRINTGTHSLYHPGGTAFGALLYGFYVINPADHQSYGYPLGFVFPDQDSLTTIPPPNPTHPTTPKPDADLGEMCFSCKDTTHVYLCDTVVRCAKTQHCYVESMTSATGHITYNSGCIDATVCNITTSPIVRTTHQTCLQCCTGDYCNSHGCGGEGLPPRDKRGPLCFDCGSVTDMSECQTLRLCFEKQVCSIERFLWGGSFSHYTAKCHNNQCVSTKRTIADCTYCCRGDLCNTHCHGNSGNSSAVILG